MEYVRCNLCDGDHTDVRFPSTMQMNSSSQNWSAYACTHNGYGRHHTIVQCRHCGLVYTNPRINRNMIIDNYLAVEDPLYVEEHDGRKLTFERHIKQLERLIGSPDGRSLLDVGCYTGVFVEIAAQRGWDSWGVEPSQWAVNHSAQRGLHIIQGTLDSPNLNDRIFDVITMWDVIEHVPDPCATLQQAQRLLNPGGVVVIHTIDIESVFARILGSNWPWLMEMHIYYFSQGTMRAMLEKCGFTVIKSHPQGRYMRLGYLLSRLSALAPTFGKPLERLVTQLGLRKLALPVNSGDLFTVYARKAE